MRVFKQYGTKERLFEMMKNVNKDLIKEDFDFNDAERDHLGQQDMEADQQQNPENWDNSAPASEKEKPELKEEEENKE